MNASIDARMNAVADTCDEPFELRDADDIRACLQRLIDHRCSVIAHLEYSQRVPTMLLAQADDALWLDAPRDEWLSDRLQRAVRVDLEAALERVTVRFSIDTPRLSEHATRPALLTALPSRVLYLQRRDHVRRSPHALACSFATLDNQGRARPHQAIIDDISGGGLSLLTTENEGPILHAGDVLNGCLIDLEPIGPIRVTLRVQHVGAVQLDGANLLRAGCQFVELSPGAESRLMRYVARLDRQHAAQARQR